MFKNLVNRVFGIFGKRNFIMQGGILAISGILVRIIGMLYRIPMANIIGTEGSGIYSTAFNIYNIALIMSSYGMPMAVSKLVSARLVKKEYKNTRRILLQALVVSIITGGVAAAILFFGAGAIESAFYSKISGLTRPLRILAPTVFIVAILGTLRGFFQGQGTMVPTAASQLIEQIVNAVVSIVASYAFIRINLGSPDEASHGAAGGTLGTCMGALAALAVIIYLIVRNRNKYSKSLASDTTQSRSDTMSTYKLIILTLIPIVIGQTFYNISAMLDDILFNNIMGNLMDEPTIKSLLGNYGQSFSTLTSIPMGIASAMSASMLPSIVNSYTLKQRGDINKKIRSTVRMTMMVAIPMMVGLIVLGQPVVQLLFRRFDSVQGSIMLKIGAVAIVFYTLSTITGAALQGIDKMKIPVWHSAISLIIHVPLVAILLAATDLHIYALVIGVMQFSAVVFILNLRSLWKYNRYKQEVIKTFLIPLTCSAIMGIVALLLYRGLYLVFRYNLPALIISVIVAVAIYFGMLALAKKRSIY